MDTKILLPESEMPTHWYNVVADMPNPPAPYLGPDSKPVAPDAMLAIFPETLVITAEYCPLRDEGAAYVQRLTQSGGAARHREFAGMVHAFLNLETLVPEACAEAYRDIGAFLN